MPAISRFFGIVISMNYNEHPPPHFHVRYSNQKALIDIQLLQLLEGKLSPRVHNMVIEWAVLHQTALKENWELARQARPLKNIPPLE